MVKRFLIDLHSTQTTRRYRYQYTGREETSYHLSSIGNISLFVNNGARESDVLILLYSTLAV